MCTNLSLNIKEQFILTIAHILIIFMTRINKAKGVWGFRIYSPSSNTIHIYRSLIILAAERLQELNRSTMKVLEI
jgi:hypothetical protein